MSENALSLTAEISFTRPDTTIAAETETILYEYSPVTGKVLSIDLHFPDGCNAYVEISCFINQTPVLPLSGVIALDDVTRLYPINRKVRRKDRLRVKISNKDTANEHTPSIVWIVEGVP